jgi:ATP-dependent helicase/nuclease subunit A
MPEVVAPDKAARDRIVKELDSTLFVEAGAGSGKTTELVERILALVETGTIELAEVAAITFTEKAATELRDRLRQKLESRKKASASDVTERYQTALDQLDGAAIGTLHAFAQRLLSEHPVEAQLPPRIEVLDEVGSEVAFEQRWVAFRDEMLADKALERTLQLLDSAGIKVAALRTLAIAFNQNWDLVAERVPETVADPPSVRERAAPVLDELGRVCDEPCRDPDDKLRLRLDAIVRELQRVRGMTDDFDLLEALDLDGSSRFPSLKVGGLGSKGNWRDIAALRGRVAGLAERLLQVRTDVANACVERLGSELRAFTLRAADERRRAGLLEFHDLLVRARALLRDPDQGAAVREDLHRRYRRLLLDEFQDTDPIQVELAVLIAADLENNPSDLSTGRWEDVQVAEGHLFFVGDPKQSIYRFRRADISMFLAAASRFGQKNGVVELTANFRTSPAVIAWINATFGTLIVRTDNDDPPVASQPSYVPLDAVRGDPETGPPVGVLGLAVHPHDTKADELRQCEARDVAGAVARIVREEWSVSDPKKGWRRACLGDITILVPARTSLPFLEEALDSLAIPYRAESSSLVYSTRAVRDLLMVLRALADPTNELHVVAALRTPLFGCGDDDLLRFRIERSGSWSYLAVQPDSVPPDDPVGAGLAYLRSLYDERHWLAPSELLDRIARDRRAMDLGFAEGRPRDVWRRLRFVIDQARAWNEATGGNLREYLSWINIQTAEGARVAEAILPETDDDAVRIMTIHAAKGLEFPVTIVSGMSTVPKGRPALAEVVFPPTGKVGYRVGRHAKTDEYVDWAPIDEQMGYHERIRLLYVACTRARDHLIVSLHRKQRVNDVDEGKRTNAELLHDGMGPLLEELPDLGEEAGPVEAQTTDQLPALLPFDVWEADRSAALHRSARPTTISATSLTEDGERDVDEEPADAGLQKQPRDLDLPPWLKGRYGTAVGRAVHGVLQTIDLATGAGLDDAVAAQCEAEAIVDRVEDVRRLVTSALASPSIREAAAGPHWRELYVCAPVSGRQLEGYIDLLYRGTEGLVVVDYKTAATSNPSDLAQRVEGYRVQGASYALTVAATTGEHVSRVTFAFLTPTGPVELHLEDDGLSAAVDEVTLLVGQSSGWGRAAGAREGLGEAP